MSAHDAGRKELAVRTAIVCGVVAVGAGLVAGFVIARDVVFLVFLGLLFSLFLRALADLLASHTAVSPRWSLPLVLLGLLGLSALGFWLLAPQLSAQIAEAGEQLPALQAEVQSWLREREWGQQLLRTQGESFQLAHLLSPIGAIFTGLSGFVVGVVVVGLVGLFLAFEPRLYTGGLLRLVPRHRRERAAEVVHTLARALRWFLIGRAIAMTLVGISTGLALWLLDVRLAALLGLVVGLLTFIPYLGPLVGAAPIALATLPDGIERLALVLAVYAILQWVEGYVLDPLIQQRVVSLPPAITLVAQVLGGTLGGVLGVAVATPLALVGLILVQSLYVRDGLGDEIEVAGSGHG